MKRFLFLLALTLIQVCSFNPLYAQEKFDDEMPVVGGGSLQNVATFMVAGGYTMVEKDEEFLNRGFAEFRYSSPFDSDYSVEFGLGIMPNIRARQFPRAGKEPQDGTWGGRLVSELLYHPDGWIFGSDFEPHLAFGGGVLVYADELENNDQVDGFLSLGTGLLANWSEDFATRLDYRLTVIGHDTELNHNIIFNLVFPVYAFR